MTPEEQEALSLCYSDIGIFIVPLKRGTFAVFNNARELCGIIKDIRNAPDIWFAPTTKLPTISSGSGDTINLEELDL